MKYRFLKCFTALVLSLLLIGGTLFVTSAESSSYVPYDSYNYWDDISGNGRKAVYNRQMYNAETVISAKSLGVENFDMLVDVETDSDGFVYLLDRKSRIVILDKDYKFVKEIGCVTGQQEYQFTNANGLYVHSDGTIYICDTENKRVLLCDKNGVFIDEFLLPDSPLIPDNFDYKPIKAVVDSKGFLYVLSEGSYYGALLYGPDKSFVGFYGANMVKNNILGAVESLFNRMFPNNSKASKKAKTLPYSFSDIVIDGSDFVYTATDSDTKGQIKKLNPGAGSNVLDSDDVKFVDDGVNRTYVLGGALKQRIIGLDVCDDGFIYCLDATYGRIFVYDSECRMLTAFGGGMGSGTQVGSFTTASAISVNGSDILVIDSTNNSLTIFNRNNYGDRVLELTKLTNDGNCLQAQEGWEEILKEDKNLQVAYTGLARGYLAEGEYKKAMDIAKEGYDRETYALAFKYYRNEFVSENFSIIFIAIVAILILIASLLIITMKAKVVIIKNEKVRVMFRTLIHPGLSFEEIKDKGKGSVKLSILLLIIFYVSAVVKVLWGGFLFVEYDPGNFNSLWVFIQTIGLVALWVLANWMICTLMGGKGRLGEILTVTSYSLMPIIFERIIWILLSNFLLPNESDFLGILTVVALLYAFLLFIIGMMRIHEFTAGRFILTSILTVLSMAAIALLILLVMILVQQFGGFIVTIFTEIFM